MSILPLSLRSIVTPDSPHNRAETGAVIRVGLPLAVPCLLVWFVDDTLMCVDSVRLFATHRAAAVPGPVFLFRVIV